MAKLLTPAQWRMLERAAEKPVSVFENMNTIGALYTRSVVKFVGPRAKRGIAPTKLGSQYLYLRKRLAKAATFNEARDWVRSYR